MSTTASRDNAADEARRARIDRLMDAIDLVKSDKREEARAVLRDLIREDANFEDAWLWMSVAVDSLDQASICLDNVLRINPKNYAAAGALYHLRIPQLEMERRRSRLRMVRDISLTLMWALVLFVLFSGMCSIVNLTLALQATT
ncbi:MAG: hypothetical protein UZ15_CFX003000535 [Chloroflexi bacterium OLB15]|nr:MAG: hypothetical protein UZ15_CFX003000535 [Chloroflexi bacterium OLB15]